MAFVALDILPDGIDGISKSKFNKMVGATLERVGYTYWDKYVDFHFSKAAANKYHYTPRSGEPGSGAAFKGSYVANKLKQHGHTRPLEYTGDTRQRTRAMRGKIRVVKSGKNPRIILTYPQGFNRRHKDSDIRMGDEIRAVAGDEIHFLEGKAVETMEVEYEQAAREVKRDSRGRFTG
jgi:hypothetical protein